MTTTAQSANTSANSNQNVFILPQITVQHDLSNVIDDVRDGVASNGWEDVWVSCYLEGRPSTHGKLRIARSDHGVSFEARDGIQWQGSSAVGTLAQCNFYIYCKPKLYFRPSFGWLVLPWRYNRRQSVCQSIFTVRLIHTRCVRTRVVFTSSPSGHAVT